MLVLSRKEGEKVVIDIGGGIVITVVEIDRGKIRLGFECDRNIAIHREEIYKKLKREAHANRQQTGTGSAPTPSGSDSTPGTAEDSSPRE